MRPSAIGLAIALALVPVAALAQANPPPPGAISRDQFVQRHAEAAGRLFDQIDTNHTGYITREQFRAFMAQRRALRPAPAGPQPAPGGPQPAPAPGGPPQQQ